MKLMQVSNWFINARVRLWKPMVEEMYMEEIKDHQDHNGSEKNINNKTEPDKDSSPGSKTTTTTTTAPPQENTTTAFHQMNQTNNNNLKSKQERLRMMNQTAAASSPTHEFSNSTASTSPQLGGGGFTLIGSSEMEGIVQRLSPKKVRSSVATSDYMQNSPSSILSMDMDMKPGDKFGIGNERQSYSSLIAEGGGGFGGYPMGEIGRFPAAGNSGSTVSLTLGLPHCDNLSLSGTSQQSYLSNQAIQLGGRLEIGSVDTHFGGINNHPPPPPPSHSNAGFEGLNNIQNGKRFAAQLLPDFVA